MASWLSGWKGQRVSIVVERGIATFASNTEYDPCGGNGTLRDHIQGVCIEGDTLWVSGNEYLLRTSKSSPNWESPAAENESPEQDGTTVHQINSLFLHSDPIVGDDLIYATGRNVARTHTAVIKKFNKTTLVCDTENEVDISMQQPEPTGSPHVSNEFSGEGCVWKDSLWWVVHHDAFNDTYYYVSTYNSNWVYQGKYVLPAPVPPTALKPESMHWVGDYLWVAVHQTYLNIYYWNGSSFTFIRQIESPDDMSDNEQAIKDGEYVWWAANQGGDFGKLYKQDIKYNIHSAQVNVPILITISTSCGRDSQDLSAVFDELGSDANKRKIALTTDDGETECYVEIQSWSHAGEKALLRVKIPEVDDGSIIYLYFDSTHAASDGDGTAGNKVGLLADRSVATEHVWDEDEETKSFKMVQHGHDYDTSNIRDSTENRNDGAKVGVNEPIEADGHVGKAQDYDGDSDKIDLGFDSSLDVDEMTLSTWVYLTVLGDHMRALASYTNGENWFQFGVEGAPYDGTINFYGRDDNNLFRGHSLAVVTVDRWYRIGCKVGSGDEVPKVTIGGTNRSLDTDTANEEGVTHHIINTVAERALFLGGGYTDRFLEGKQCETRISNVERSEDWEILDWASELDDLLIWGRLETFMDSSVTVGLVASASGVRGYARAAAVTIGLVASAVVEAIPVIFAFVTVGLTTAATRGVTAAREAATTIGLVASALFGIPAAITVGITTTATKVVAAIRQAAVDVGLIASATRAIATIRHAATTVGLVADAFGTAEARVIAAVTIGLVASSTRILVLAREAAVVVGLITTKDTIDIGCEASDRATTITYAYTNILIENPANASGIITTVEIYAYDEVTNCKVATFYKTNGTTLKCRDVHTIGTVSAGKQTFSGLSLAVVAGDYIGVYFSAGHIDADVSGDGLWYYLGDSCVIDDERSYSFDDAITVSVYGADRTDFASRLISATREATATIGLIASATITKVLSPRLASVTIGLVTSATKTLAATRSATTVVGVIASAIGSFVGVGRYLTVKVTTAQYRTVNVITAMYRKIRIRTLGR